MVRLSYVGGWLHTKMIYSSANSDPPKYESSPTYGNYIDRHNTLTNKPCHHVSNAVSKGTDWMKSICELLVADMTDRPANADRVSASSSSLC